MKKFLLSFKMCCMTVLFLSVCSSVSAQFADDVVGTWHFTANFTLVDQDWNGEFNGDCTVTITKNSATNVTITGLAGITGEYDSWYANLDGSNTFSLNSIAIGDMNSSPISFADKEGNSPYANWPDTWQFVFTIADNNTLTVPDFTIIDMSAGNAILAKFTSVKLTRTGGAAEEDLFSGTYTVAGWCEDYERGTDGDPYLDLFNSFTLQIRKGEDAGTYEITQIAGYNTAEVYYGGCGVTGKASGEELTISPVSNTYLSTGPVYDLLGGDLGFSSVDSEGYDGNASIVFTYDGGDLIVSNFSVYSYNWSTQEYTIKKYYTMLSASKTSAVESTVAEPAAKVTVNGGNIVILGDYSKASIVDLSGRVIALDAAASTSVDAGLYIVVVDGKAVKVLVK